ncbi:MAG TPA: thrombospondin type 3 repeat-containing protein [Planctomycetota bacterium]|nr:thrombospondin type 3 repeat-containing protein [Planctomycetota bacterium]
MKKSHKTAWRAVGALVALALVVLLAEPIFAQKAFLSKIKKLRPDLVENKLATCRLCHNFDKEKKEEATKDNLNAYGKDIQKDPNMKTVINQKEGDEHKFTEEELALFEKAFNAIMDKDSDGDGATNAEEMALGTNPGDPKSTPDKAALEKYRAEHKK